MATRVTDGTHQTPKFVGEGVPFLVIGNVVGGRIDWDSVSKWVTLSTYEECTARCRPERGDVLYTAVGSYGVALVVDTDVPFMFQRHIAHIKPNAEMVDPRYLAAALNGPELQSRAHAVARGVAQKTVTLGELKAFPLVLPPLNEQRRIVAKLDAIFAQTRAAKTRLDRLPALLDKLKRSILASAFRGDLTADWRAAHPNVDPASALIDRIRAARRRRWEASLAAKGKNPSRASYEEPVSVDISKLPSLPHGWTWASLDDCCHFVTSGSRGWAEYYSESGPLFIRVGNLARSGIDLLLDDVQRVSPPPGAEGERTKVEVGDVLVSITADVGRLGVVGPGIGDAYINQHVALSRPAEPSLGTFLAVALLNPLGFQKFIVGAQYGMTKASLSLDQVRSAPIAVPPEAEIAAVLDAIAVALRVVDAITLRVAESRGRLDAIEQAALAKAFRGELVQQDPTDEPAAALLDRIPTAAQHATTAKGVSPSPAAASRTRAKARVAESEP